MWCLSAERSRPRPTLPHPPASQRHAAMTVFLRQQRVTAEPGCHTRMLAESHTFWRASETNHGLERRGLSCRLEWSLLRHGDQMADLPITLPGSLQSGCLPSFALDSGASALHPIVLFNSATLLNKSE